MKTLNLRLSNNKYVICKNNNKSKELPLRCLRIGISVEPCLQGPYCQKQGLLRIIHLCHHYHHHHNQYKFMILFDR